MMPGDGGGNGWEYQVDGTVPAKANGARGGGAGGGNLWVTQAEWHVQPEISMWEGEGRGFGRKFMVWEIEPHHENSHSLQGGTIRPQPLRRVCWCLGLGAS